MKVILLKDIAKLGKRGDVKEVADSYAINVLIKKNYAVMATQKELAQWKVKEDAKIHRKEVAENAFVALVDALQKQEVIIRDKKSDNKGQLFAHVKEHDIADAIFSVTNLSIDPKQVRITQPIKSCGKHPFVLEQGTRKAELFLTVI